jgi:hypothetical protein
MSSAVPAAASLRMTTTDVFAASGPPAVSGTVVLCVFDSSASCVRAHDASKVVVTRIAVGPDVVVPPQVGRSVTNAAQIRRKARMRMAHHQFQ